MAVLAVGTQATALNHGFAAWQMMVVSVMAFFQLAQVLAIRAERELLKQDDYSLIYLQHSALWRRFSITPLRPG